MANVFPKLLSAEIENPGERDVYNALLQNAPADWEVRYHYSYAWKEGKRIFDGEIDFIVLIPRCGVIVLEVKSSHGYDCIEGVWCRVDKKLHRERTASPFDQAMSNKHRLVNQLCKAVYGTAKSKFPGLYAFSVVYPRGKFDGAIPESCDRSVLIANKDMDRLPERLFTILKNSGPVSVGEQFCGLNFQKTREYLKDSANIVPVMSPNVQDDNLTIEALTCNQYHALRGLLSNKRLHVKGCAGSGKTLLARWSAESMASTGRRVLLTCFNRNLANWIRLECKGGSGVEVKSFFSLARELIVASGADFRLPESSADHEWFWKETAPVMLCNALEMMDQGNWHRFDAIVVDEAQDFAANWWLPLQLLLDDPDRGLIQIFSDEDQAGVYGASQGYPTNLIELELLDNCRNTRAIANFASGIFGKAASSFTLTPKGISPQIHDAEQLVERRAKVARRIFNELCEQGFKPSQIAILSPYSSASDKSSLKHLGKVRTLSVLGDDKCLSRWREDRVVWGSTVKAFKGMEADCVILCDIGTECIELSAIPDTYVGSTRAKHILHVIPSDEPAARYLRLLRRDWSGTAVRRLFRDPARCLWRGEGAM